MSNEINNGSKISLGTATIIGINAMIGAGVIAIPGLLARFTGPAGILAFAFSMVVAMLIGISLGDLAQLYPGEGWNYRYPAAWGGHFWGMVSSISYFIGVLVAMGFVAQQGGIYLHLFIPALSAPALGGLLLVVLTLLVLAGAEISSWGQYVIVFFVLVPLLLTTVLCGLHFDARLLTPFMPFGVSSILSAAPIALFSFLGFESIASLYSVVKNPTKNVARACVLAVCIVGVLYIAFAGSVIFSVPTIYFAGQPQKTLVEVIALSFPSYKFLGSLVMISALFAIVGTLHSMIWSLSVLFISLIKRMRSSCAAQLVARTAARPQIAVLLIAAAMLLFSLTISGELLVSMTTFFMVPSFALSIIALFFVPGRLHRGQLVRGAGALVGSMVMFYYASLPVFEFVRSFFL